MLKIVIVSKKMIKPCTPTPLNLKYYNISSIDQSQKPMNIPIILFYSLSPSNNDLDLMSINRLQQSLANILPRFYPLAGRYISKDHLVHCNDEGVEFVESRACSENFKNITEYVGSGTHEQLNDMLLPRLSWEADEATDPMVSIQATRFVCGGLAIGFSVSHRIVDADSISTFIRAWAEEANSPSLNEWDSKRIVINPSFNSPTLLPIKNLVPGSKDIIQLPRTIDPNIICKRYLFNKDTIATLKAKIRDRSRRVSKVGVVCALISKALIHVDWLKHGRVRNFLVGQVVNIRDRTTPPFPKHSCGNLFVTSTVKLRPSNPIDDDRNLNVGFEDLVSLLRDAIDKTIDDCESLFNNHSADERRNMFNPLRETRQENMSSNEEITKFFCFSDLSKFEFYRVDFGRGKPIWTSIGTMPVDNVILLLGNKEGDGIEAWIHMLKQDMALFEQHEDITWLNTLNM